ncbi:MAG TPA: tyrosine-type recombinase/integrase [Thermoleophilaceae bacterium]
MDERSREVERRLELPLLAFALLTIPAIALDAPGVDEPYKTNREPPRQDHRPLGSIQRHEAIVWAESVPPSMVPIVVTLFNRAVDEELIDRNPFRKLGRRTKGRSDEAPPTEEEFDKLLDACAALKGYAGQMRALVIFAAHTCMRPGELFALAWSDIDFKANRVHVARRVYKGSLDLPKSNEERTIALPPAARGALLRQPTRGRVDGLVFASKTGKPLSQPTLSGYWSQVKAAAGLEFDFYLATKHYAVHLLYKLGLSKRAIAAQTGWSEGAVEKLLRVYGHADLVALEEVDALYAKVVPLRALSGGAQA